MGGWSGPKVPIVSKIGGVQVWTNLSFLERCFRAGDANDASFFKVVMQVMHTFLERSKVRENGTVVMEVMHH